MTYLQPLFCGDQKKTIVLFGGFERDQNNVEQITVTALDHSKIECQINNLNCNLLKYLSWKQTTEGIFLRFQSQGIKFPQTFFNKKHNCKQKTNSNFKFQLSQYVYWKRD